MPRPDAAASAALSGDIWPVHFIFLDFAGDPVRINTSGRKLTLADTGIPDLDGIYLAATPQIVQISDVKITERGTDTVTATLSGLPSIDVDVLNVIGDKTRYKGRLARLWRMIRDETRTQRGGIQHYYTGYMMNAQIGGTRENQRVTIPIENYLAAFAAPSMRTYLDAAEFDPDDRSAEATIAIANGMSGNPLVNNTGTGSGLGGGGSRNYYGNVRSVNS